jgi:arsenate reductase-like glutaredoxin family protein
LQSTSKEPVGSEDALSLLDGVDELVVTRGKKILSFDLVNDRPGDEEILGLILGRSGKLRAPAIRAGARLLVGYAPGLLERHLL